MFTLVLLRISIGWHFLYAGIDKLTSPNFTSAGYLSQSKGPLAEEFHKLVPDWDGRERFGELDPALKADQEAKKVDALKVVTDRWTAPLTDYKERFADHFKLSPEQQAATERSYYVRKAAMADYIAAKQEDLEGYFHDLARLKRAQENPTAEMPFQVKRNWDKQTDLRSQLTGWAKDLDKIGSDFRDDLARLLNDEQLKRGAIAQPFMSRVTQDNIVIYSNLAIGFCLMAGLFTRLAALGGALFLLPVVLAQPDWPGIYPPPPPAAGRTFIVGKEFIEMMALFMLATTHVGRWGGLDFFVHHLLVKPVYGQRESK